MTPQQYHALLARVTDRAILLYRLELIAQSTERRELDYRKQHILLGDWQLQPNPHAPKRGTAKLTPEMLPVPTVPIPIEEQITGRMTPIEVHV